MFKTVWVAGMARAGSMWTFNVTRDLLRQASFEVRPEKVLIEDHQWVALAEQEARRDQDPNRAYVMKIHSCIHGMPDQDLVISNIRDLRDVVMSWMRFMRVGFDEALASVASLAEVAEHYDRFPKDRVLILRYDEITRGPMASIRKIAARLGLQPEEAAIADLAERFDKSRIKNAIDQRDRQIQTAHAAGIPTNPDHLIGTRAGSLISLDRRNGFQTDHVSDYRDGDWRKLLSRAEIDALHQRFGGWLERHGFASSARKGAPPIAIDGVGQGT
jgi:hypothetical protein